MKAGLQFCFVEQPNFSHYIAMPNFATNASDCSFSADDKMRGCDGKQITG